MFCKDCCHLKLPIPDQQLYDPVLVCNTCYDLLLESRTREIRSQQLKKAIATASSWAQRHVAWPDSALSCSLWAPWPHPAMLWAAGTGRWGGIIAVFEKCCLETKMHCETVWEAEKRKCQRGRFSYWTNPFCSKTFQPRGFAAASCLPVAQSSSGTLSRQRVHPPLVPNTCTILADAVSHLRGQSFTLPCVGDSNAFTCTTGGFNFKKKNCCYSI